MQEKLNEVKVLIVAGFGALTSSETTSQYMNNDETEIVSGAFGW